eukprot:7072849-Prymnesium_polylepis.1
MPAREARACHRRARRRSTHSPVVKSRSLLAWSIVSLTHERATLHVKSVPLPHSWLPSDANSLDVSWITMALDGCVSRQAPERRGRKRRGPAAAPTWLLGLSGSHAG